MPEEFQLQISDAGAGTLAVEVLENIVYLPDTMAAMFDCTYYAVANLHLLMGLEPPPIERMKLLWQAYDPSDGVTTAEAMAILCELNVPGLVAVGCIPHGLTAKDVFPPLMEAGWHLLKHQTAMIAGRVSPT